MLPFDNIFEYFQRLVEHVIRLSDGDHEQISMVFLVLPLGLDLLKLFL